MIDISSEIQNSKIKSKNQKLKIKNHKNREGKNPSPLISPSR